MRKLLLGTVIGVNVVAAGINILSSSGALLNDKPGVCLVYGALATFNAYAVVWLVNVWRGES
jgi:hypothetical protein